MLTSSMVQINMKLPKSDSKTIAPSDLNVMIKLDGDLTVNGKAVSWNQLERELATLIRYTDNKENAAISIISESGVQYEKIHRIMKIASSLQVRAILATEPNK
jgi:biopolymer transport protein ExbD